jgi:hypothetical protein
MSAETRDFPTAVIASLSSGISLCEFSKLHEAAEYLMGHPIWTHHFADPELWSDMQQTIAEQCPGMPTEIEGVTPENYLDHVGELEKTIRPDRQNPQGLRSYSAAANRRHSRSSEG